MSYCLNPVCQKPQNPNGARFCQNCGSRLLLGDRYRALQLIGQGGFGRTFLAVDESQPSKPGCVIKQFFPRTQSLAIAQKAAELFRQEALRLAELGQHPQIPALLAHFEFDHGQYLVQEYVSGENLAIALAEEGPFDEAQIRELLSKLLPVLKFIHDNQVIHRDLKPENIIRRGADSQLVLVDFGASKFVTDAVAKTGTVIGSAGYVAPEQAIGKTEFASDLYSLGVTCIHLLTAIHPFDLYSVVEDGWVWQQYLSKPVSHELSQVLDRLLQRSLRQRYRSAADVLQDLHFKPLKLGKAIRVTSVPAIAVRSTAQLQRSATASGSHSKLQSQTWNCVKTLTDHASIVTAIATSPDNQTFASGRSDKTIKLWSLATGELQHVFPGRSLWFRMGHTDRISTLLFNADGQMLVSGSDDGTVKLWDLDTQKLMNTLSEHDWGVSSVHLGLPGDQILVSGSEDSTIKLWYLKTGQLIGNLMKHRGGVSSVLISPDHQILVSGGYDTTIRLWDLGTGKLINTLTGHRDRVSAIAVTPDWQTLISSSWDKTIKIWRFSTGALLHTLVGHRDRVNAIALSSDGQVLASASDDSRIKLWHLETQELLCNLVEHSWGVNAVAFSPDGQTLVSGSTDETIKIWQRQV